MVYVLFLNSSQQPSFLKWDVTVKDVTQVDFLMTEDVEKINQEERQKSALSEIFPQNLSTNLHHLKPLYVTEHIESFLVSKVFINCGTMVNIMLVLVMKTLKRSKDKLIPFGITMSCFVGDKSQTKGVLPLEVMIADQSYMTTFFIVNSRTEYNALFCRDWIHQANYISSSLYQVLIFWYGKSVYYDKNIGCITLQGFNIDGVADKDIYSKSRRG